MPLIRAIGRFFRRRMDVGYSSAGLDGSAGSASMTPDVVRAEFRGDLGGFGSASDASGMVWIGFMLIMAPAILFLTLVGLIYELLIRVTMHRLPRMSDWTLSLLAAIALVGVAGVALVHLVWPA